MSPVGKPGKIVTASADLFADGLGVARLGDVVAYVDGTVTTIAEGDPYVSDAGRPIVRRGYLLADGGRVLEGSPTAFSGSPTPGAGTVAEATLVAARRGAAAFVAIDCEARLATALPAPVEPLPAPTSPLQAVDEPPVPLTRDLAAGGARAFHGPDALVDGPADGAGDGGA